MKNYIQAALILFSILFVGLVALSVYSAKKEDLTAAYWQKESDKRDLIINELAKSNVELQEMTKGKLSASAIEYFRLNKSKITCFKSE